MRCFSSRFAAPGLEGDGGYDDDDDESHENAKQVNSASSSFGMLSAQLLDSVEKLMMAGK